jgi:ankyrin repeat protein
VPWTAVCLNNHPETDKDPLVLENVSRRVITRFEALAESSCASPHQGDCATLHNYYGGLFRCPKYHCRHHYCGFVSRADREKHLRKHDRPFKCSEPSCDFNSVGFSTEPELREHLKGMHSKRPTGVELDSASLDFQDDDEFRKTLGFAAEAGDLDLVQNLLRLARSKEFSVDWQQLIESAAKSGSEELFEYLLECEWSLWTHNEPVDEKIRAMFWYYAATYGLEGSMKKLVSSGKPPEDGAWRPLHGAIAGGFETIVSMLLDSGADIEALATIRPPDTKRSNWSGRPLHIAVLARNEALVELLLDQGANLHSRNNLADTALHLAARHGLEDLAELLLERGASVETRGYRDQTPLCAAARKVSKPLVELLLRYGEELKPSGLAFTALHSVTQSKKSSKDVNDMIRLLVEKGLPVDTKSADGQTPLHWAAKRSTPEVVGLLIELGADPTIETNDSRTPLHEAVSRAVGFGYSENEEAMKTKIIQILCENMADITTKNSALWLSLDGTHNQRATFRPVERIRLMLTHGADLHFKVPGGGNMLFLGFRAISVDAVQLLLDHGTDPRAVDDSGNTVLHHLATELSRRSNVFWDPSRAEFEIVAELLVSAGADPTAKNKALKTGSDALKDFGLRVKGL